MKKKKKIVFIGILKQRDTSDYQGSQEKRMRGRERKNPEIKSYTEHLFCTRTIR